FNVRRAVHEASTDRNAVIKGTQEKQLTVVLNCGLECIGIGGVANLERFVQTSVGVHVKQTQCASHEKTAVVRGRLAAGIFRDVGAWWIQQRWQPPQQTAA